MTPKELRELRERALWRCRHSHGIRRQGCSDCEANGPPSGRARERLAGLGFASVGRTYPALDLILQVAEAECETKEDRGCDGWPTMMQCWPCRMRRELADFTT